MKLILGCCLIFFGVLTLLVATPKEGFEFAHYPAVIFIILYGCYLNYKYLKD